MNLVVQVIERTYPYYDTEEVYKKEYNNIYLAIQDFREKCRIYPESKYEVSLTKKY
jgi:hypothetical protein|nr:MAG TPA: hypothetical protein [Caudoviricetes sp.]